MLNLYIYAYLHFFLFTVLSVQFSYASKLKYSLYKTSLKLSELANKLSKIVVEFVYC